MFPSEYLLDNAAERRRSGQSSGLKLTKDLISTPFNFNHIQGVYKDSPEQFIVEGVHDLQSLEILQNNLLQTKKTKENAVNLAATQRSSLDEFEGNDSDDSDVAIIMNAIALENKTPQKPARFQKMLTNRRKSKGQAVSKLDLTALKSSSNEDDRTVTSSPDLELRDPSFFESLLHDNGSPRPEPTFSFIFDIPPSSPPPANFWSLPNGSFNRTTRHHDSGGSYTTTSHSMSSESPELLHASSLSLSSSATRNSEETEDEYYSNSTSTPSPHLTTEYTSRLRRQPRVTKV